MGRGYARVGLVGGGRERARARQLAPPTHTPQGANARSAGTWACDRTMPAQGPELIILVEERCRRSRRGGGGVRGGGEVLVGRTRIRWRRICRKGIFETRKEFRQEYLSQENTWMVTNMIRRSFSLHSHASGIGVISRRQSPSPSSEERHEI